MTCRVEFCVQPKFDTGGCPSSNSVNEWAGSFILRTRYDFLSTDLM